jgi:hypothetical protein
MPINLQASSPAVVVAEPNARSTMLSNSRPPLSHRIRASFEARKSNEKITSPKRASFGATADPELLRHAIEQAIGGDAFQASIASHLANLLRPQIREALDTIEPVVQAVLKHENLWKKTNASVENILLRLDTIKEEDEPGRSRLNVHGALTSHPVQNNVRGVSADATTLSSVSEDHPTPILNRNSTYTVGKLSEISDSLDDNNEKIGRAIEGITGVKDILISNEPSDSIKTNTEKSATNTAVIQAQLDQLQDNVSVIITRIGADLGTNVKAINEHLSGERPGRGANTERLEKISWQLDTLRADLESGVTSTNDNFSALKDQLTNLQSALDVHATFLGDIKTGDNSAEVLAAVRKGNELHESHATILGELKERNIQPESLSAPATAIGGEETTKALESIAKDLASMKEHIHAGVTSTTNLGTKVDEVLTSLEEQKSADASAEILAEVKKSNEAHVAHAVALEGIRALPTPPPEVDSTAGLADLSGLEEKVDVLVEKLEECRGVLGDLSTRAGDVTPPTLNTAVLDGHLSEIKSTLENHSASLDEIKSKNVDLTRSAVDAAVFNSHFDSIKDRLDAHAVSLDEMKTKNADVSSRAMDTSIFDTHFESIRKMLETHAASLEDIKARSTTTEPASAVDTTLFDEHFGAIKGMLKDHAASLDEVKARSHESVSAPVNNVAFDEHFGSIKSLLEGHSAALEEIRAKSAAGESKNATLDASVLQEQLGAIKNVLEMHAASLDEIQASAVSLKTTPTQIDPEIFNPHFSSLTTLLESHTSALDELKSHATSTSADLTSTFNAHLNTIINTLESHTSALEDVKSKSVETRPRSDSNGFESFEPHITAIKSALDAHMLVLDELKSHTLGKSQGPDLEPHLTSIKSQLDDHSSTLAQLHSSTLPKSEDNSIAEILEPHLRAIRSLLDRHSVLLKEIKNADVSDEILTALHELAASNGLKLDEIREGDVSEEILTALHTCNEAQERLGEGLVGLRGELGSRAGSQRGRSGFEFEGEEREIGEDLKEEKKKEDVVDEPENERDMVVLGEKIDGIMQVLEGQNEMLGHIREVGEKGLEVSVGHAALLGEMQDAIGVSNGAHTNHSVVLGEIKYATTAARDLQAGHADGLNAVKQAVESSKDSHTADLGHIEEALASSNEFHTSHATALAEIRDATSTARDTLSAHTTHMEQIKEQTAASNSSLSAHTAHLEDIKERLKIAEEESGSKHNELKGTLAGLAVGGVLAAGVAAATRGGGEKDLGGESKTIADGEGAGGLDEALLAGEETVQPSVESKDIEEEVPVSMEREIEDEPSIPVDEPLLDEADKPADETLLLGEEPDSSLQKETLSHKDEDETTSDINPDSVLEVKNQENQPSPVQEPEESAVSNPNPSMASPTNHRHRHRKYKHNQNQFEMDMKNQSQNKNKNKN